MIRPAEPARDAAACAAIYGPYVRDSAVSFEETAPTEHELAQRIARSGATHPWLVAERDGRVVGFAYASPHRERAAYRWAANVAVYVDPVHHRRGVARQLYEALLELLREQHVHIACAGIALPNDASIGLHEALGFEHVGIYRDIGFKAGGWHDVSWWQLRLAPADGPPQEPLAWSRPAAGVHGATDAAVARGADDRRTAVVTGVSRRSGIGFAIAQRFLELGMNVLIQSWSAHDARGREPTAAIVERLGGSETRLAHVEADFRIDDAPERVMAATVERFGHVDVLVASHAHSLSGSLLDVTTADLDVAWTVNARASVMLAKAFAAQHDDERGPGRIVLFTSGQHLAPMRDELAYAVSKGAIHQMTRTLADTLADRGITVNALNPGPVDTGYADAAAHAQIAAAFPAGRWGSPLDVAAVVTWLTSPESQWITGQVIDAEGGFRRHSG